MKKTLEMAAAVTEEAELYQIKSESNEVVFEANRLKSANSSFEEGTGLRVIKEGKIGFSSSTDLAKPQELVRAALDSAQFGEKAYFHLPPGGGISSVQCYDRNLALIDLEQMIEEGNKAIGQILKEAPSLHCEAEVARIEVEVSILNTSGLSQSYKKTSYSFSLGAFIAEEGDFLGIGEGEASVRHYDWSSSVAQRVIEAFRLTRRKGKISAGRYPVIFTSKAVPLLLQSLKQGINGKVVQKKISPLLKKMGKPIESGKVKIRAKEYVCPSCSFTEEKQAHEESLTLEAKYLCPSCGKEGESTTEYKRSSFMGVKAYVVECSNCKAKIPVTKKMKDVKKK